MLVASLLAALAGLAWALCYLCAPIQTHSRWTVAFTSFLPLALPTTALAALGFLAAGRRWTKLLALPCLVGVVAQLAWLAPYAPHAAPAASGKAVRVLTLNTMYGKADPDALIAWLDAERPDVVLLNEIQQPLMTALKSRGLLERYPNWLGTIPPGWPNGPESARGAIVLAQSLQTASSREAYNAEFQVIADVGGTKVQVFTAHPRNPLWGVDDWQHDISDLAGAIQPQLDRPLVVVGDFNAVGPHVPFRRLLDLGLADAATRAGSGWQPTYPAGRSFPALLPLDHVLTGPTVTATATRTKAVPGTDHLGLVADLVIGS